MVDGIPLILNFLRFPESSSIDTTRETCPVTIREKYCGLKSADCEKLRCEKRENCDKVSEKEKQGCMKEKGVCEMCDEAEKYCESLRKPEGTNCFLILTVKYGTQFLI